MKSKLVIGLVTAGLFLAGFGGAVLPASAEPHHFLLKLANGTSIPWTGEPGTAPSTITVAGVPIAVISVQDLGAVVQQVTPPPTPAPATPAPPTTPAPTTPAQQTPAQPKAPRAVDADAGAEVERAAAGQEAREEGQRRADRQRRDPAAHERSHARPSLKRRPETSKKTTKTTTKTDKPAKKDTTPKSPGDNAAPVPATHTAARAEQPDLLARAARGRADRRAELLHRQVPDPAVPAPDLPGRRHPVRHPLGGPRGDQRDRDRLRAQPQRLLRRRARLDAVHARDLVAVRHRRQPRRQARPVQPGRRHLRHRPLPQGRRRRAGHQQGRLRLQPRELVRRLRPACARG